MYDDGIQQKAAEEKSGEALFFELFDPVPIGQMADAELAVHEAAANISEEVRERFETADQLSDEDQKTIIEIARQALARFRPMAVESPDGPKADGESRPAAPADATPKPTPGAGPRPEAGP